MKFVILTPTLPNASITVTTTRVTTTIDGKINAWHNLFLSLIGTAISILKILHYL